MPGQAAYRNDEGDDENGGTGTESHGHGAVDPYLTAALSITARVGAHDEQAEQT